MILRWRLRTLMVAVAVVGLAIAATQTGLRSMRYRRLAAMHAQERRATRAQAAELDKQRQWAMRSAREGHALTAPPGSWDEIAERSRSEAARFRRLSDHEAGLELKYEHAAARPWLPVEPDQPPPK